ncbi:MAG: YraN family protein [Acutalibacteraceae bacterium]
MTDKKQIGKVGEDFAASYFQKLGFEIKARNYHSRYGEIDLIAENSDTVVFAEVKTRSFDSLDRAAGAVNTSKQKKLVLTALRYINENNCEKIMRFDVFEVYHANGRIYKFNNIENAFEGSDFGDGLGYY